MADKLNQGATEKVGAGAKRLNQGAWQDTSEAAAGGLSIPVAYPHYKQLMENG